MTHRLNLHFAKKTSIWYLKTTLAEVVNHEYLILEKDPENMLILGTRYLTQAFDQKGENPRKKKAWKKPTKQNNCLSDHHTEQDDLLSDQGRV